MEIRRCRAEIAEADLLPTERTIRMTTLRMMTRIRSTAEDVESHEKRHDLSPFFETRTS
jgi:hypothetical protein